MPLSPYPPEYSRSLTGSSRANPEGAPRVNNNSGGATYYYPGRSPEYRLPQDKQNQKDEVPGNLNRVGLPPDPVIANPASQEKVSKEKGSSSNPEQNLAKAWDYYWGEQDNPFRNDKNALQTQTATPIPQFTQTIAGEPTSGQKNTESTGSSAKKPDKKISQEVERQLQQLFGVGGKMVV